MPGGVRESAPPIANPRPNPLVELVAAEDNHPPIVLKFPPAIVIFAQVCDVVLKESRVLRPTVLFGRADVKYIVSMRVSVRKPPVP